MNYAIIVDIIGGNRSRFCVCNPGAIHTNTTGRDVYRLHLKQTI